MMASVLSPALGGPRLLVLATGPVEIDHLRRLGFTEIAVTRQGPDGSYDDRIEGPFDHAIVTAPRIGGPTIRVAMTYAFERLAHNGVVQLIAPDGMEDAHHAVAAALPDMIVEISSLPAPSTRRCVQVRRPTTPIARPRRLLRASLRVRSGPEV